MKTRIAFFPHQRLVRGLLVVLPLAAVPLAHGATDLAEKPIVISTLPPPNIMVTLDNSSSMRWGYVNDGNLPNFARNCLSSAQFNRIYYDPKARYTPGRKTDGSSYDNSQFTSAYVDGYHRDYSFYTTGVGSANSEGGYSRPGGYQTGPVDLSRNFQSTFDAMRYDVNPLVVYLAPPQPAFYHVYNGPQPADRTCHDDANYTKVIVGPAERQNFANWFTYYRTRALTMQTVLTQTIAVLDENYRVGLSTINNDDTTWNSGQYFVPVDNFSPRQKANWVNTVFDVKFFGGTPLIQMLQKIGEYYAGRPPFPGGPSFPDPVPNAVMSCQRNFELIATDGAWRTPTNQPAVGDWDSTVPALPGAVPFDPIAQRPLIPGTPFPPPFAKSVTTRYNIADPAMKYWSSNLRPGAPVANAVLPTRLDPATWPHMSTYAITFGAGGTLNPDAATYNAIVSGALAWPMPVSDTPTAVDDLWHATLNGHGKFLSTNSSGELRNSFQSALTEMASGTFSNASIGISKPDVGDGDSVAFATTYDPGGWTGDLAAYGIDAQTGVASTAKKWSAQDRLESMDWRLRNIATSVPLRSGAGNNGVSFSAGALPAALRARLNSPVPPPGPADNADVIEFLRGNREQESRLYRTRPKVLGDLIGAEPAYVGPPSARYIDAGYASYVASKASRPGMVYQGANDGMLHAFDATTGVERWAYVPGLLLTAPYVTQTGINYQATSSLVNLSTTSGFTHLPYVDGTPVAADVNMGRPGRNRGLTNWKTILVGGLGKGGRGYYALDVTDPPAAKTDVNGPDTAARLAMWEFPQGGTDPATVRNIGYTYGTPVIVKTLGTGWVVLVTSGYNNGADTGGDGRGHLFVLDPATGAVIRDIPTPSGTTSQPSGLAQISAYSEQNNVNNTTDFVYGGDLTGSLWRFDLRAADPASWNVKLLAKLVDANGNGQPISSAPELASIKGVRVVYAGTGQYLGNSDRPGAGGNANATQTQSLYGLVDDRSTNPTIAPLRTKLVRQTIRPNGNGAAVTANTVDLASGKGWYLDLPNSFERVIYRPTLVAGTVSFSTSIPGTDPCLPFGNAWLYTLDYANGGAVSGKTDAFSGYYFGSTMASRPVTIRTKDRKFHSIVRTFGGNLGAQNGVGQPGARDPSIVTRDSGADIPPPVGHRVFWREVMPN